VILLLSTTSQSASAMATNGASSSNTAQASNAQANGIIAALGNAFKSQTGDALNNNQIAKLLQSNIGQLSQLAKEGKLSQQQILQVRWHSYAPQSSAESLMPGCLKVEGLCRSA